MLELAEAGLPRAFLRIGGTSVAQQQFSLAVALGCERIVCLAAGIRPEIIALQHQAEAAGIKFHAISVPRALVGLVTAQDEIIVLGDGLFASRSAATELLADGPVVLVQPIDQGLAGGFERIDINHTGAAALRIPGRLVEQLADLPSDCDAVSVLQRIALQSGVRQRPIPPLTDAKVFWTLVRTEDEAHAIEPRWVRQRTRGDQPIYPARALALFTARRFGPSLLHAGSGATHVSIGAALLVVMALGAGWLKLPVVGLILCAIGWIVGEAADLLERIEHDAGSIKPSIFGRMVGFGAVVDVLIIGLAAWGTAMEPWQPLPDRFFPPFMLVALLRILPKAISAGWTAWLNDRALLALALVAAILSGVGAEAIHLAAMAAAIAGIVLPGLSHKLTRS